MIITVSSMYGGIGKTMLAVNLAIMRALAGGRVLLIESTSGLRHVTALRAARLGEAGYQCHTVPYDLVRDEIARLADRYTDVIVDTPASTIEVHLPVWAASDQLLLPLEPSRSLRTLPELESLIADAKLWQPRLQVRPFVNAASDPWWRKGGRPLAYSMFHEALMRLKGATPLPVTIGHFRQPFHASFAFALAIVELGPTDAAAALEALYSGVYGTAMPKVIPKRRSTRIPPLRTILRDYEAISRSLEWCDVPRI